MIKEFVTMVSFFIVFLSIFYLENSYGQNMNNYERGNELFNEGKYVDAIGYYDQELSINPNNVDALYNKGLALAHLKRYNGAITYYDKALEIDPNNAKILDNKRLTLGTLGR